MTFSEQTCRIQSEGIRLVGTSLESGGGILPQAQVTRRPPCALLSNVRLLENQRRAHRGLKELPFSGEKRGAPCTGCSAARTAPVGVAREAELPVRRKVHRHLVNEESARVWASPGCGTAGQWCSARVGGGAEAGALASERPLLFG